MAADAVKPASPAAATQRARPRGRADRARASANANGASGTPPRREPRDTAASGAQVTSRARRPLDGPRARARSHLQRRPAINVAARSIRPTCQRVLEPRKSSPPPPPPAQQAPIHASPSVPPAPSTSVSGGSLIVSDTPGMMAPMPSRRASPGSRTSPRSRQRRRLPLRPPDARVRAFSVNAFTATRPAADRGPRRDRLGAGRREELYVVIAGDARFTINGAEHDAGPGTLVFVPDQSRRSAIALSAVDSARRRRRARQAVHRARRRRADRRQGARRRPRRERRRRPHGRGARSKHPGNPAVLYNAASFSRSPAARGGYDPSPPPRARPEDSAWAAGTSTASRSATTRVPKPYGTVPFGAPPRAHPRGKRGPVPLGVRGLTPLPRAA